MFFVEHFKQKIAATAQLLCVLTFVLLRYILFQPSFKKGNTRNGIVRKNNKTGKLN